MTASRVVRTFAVAFGLLACSSDSTSSSSGDQGSTSGSSSSSSSGTTALPWACLENATSCDCFNGPTTGYSATSCKAYSCCRTKDYKGGLQECSCTNTTPCTAADGWTPVDHCPR